MSREKESSVEKAPEKKYGLKLDGEIVNTCNSPLEAYHDALFAYKETGVFLEVVRV